MADITVRELKEGDLSLGFLKTLDSLKKASHLDKNKVTEIFKKIQGQPNQIIYVVEKNNEIIGSATLLIEQKFIHEGSRVGHIEDVVVSKNFQNEGIGKILIEYLLKKAEVLGCYKTVLNCLEDVKPFYEKLNFSQHLVGMRFDHK